MSDQLKDRVARGVAWSMAEKVGTMLLQMVVSLVVLRLLSPAILGALAIPTAMVAVALVMVDSGFSQALIRKAEPSARDYKSVFLLNLIVAAALYALFVAASPMIARFYDIAPIAVIAPVFFLQLPLGALCTIQNTIFSRQFRFELLSKVTFVSWFAAAMAAVGLAVAGLGIWAIVAQRVLQIALRAAMLWWLSDWRPRGEWGREPLREMAPFSLGVMSTDLLSTFFSKIPQFAIGRLYSTPTLGSFDQAIKIKDMPTISLTQAVQSVTYPAFTKIGSDGPKLAESYRQVVMVVAYVMFPTMMGMSAVAHDMFAVCLGSKWMQTVPYFEAVCLVGLFYPIGIVAYNMLKVKSTGGLILRLEIVKKIIMTAIFVITIPRGVQAVVWGLVAIAFCEMAVNFLATTRFTQLTLYRFVRTLLPVALTSAAMYGVVRLTVWAMPAEWPLLRLMISVAAGGASYLLLSALFRLEAFRELVGIIKKQVAR